MFFLSTEIVLRDDKYIDLFDKGDVDDDPILHEDKLFRDTTYGGSIIPLNGLNPTKLPEKPSAPKKIGRNEPCSCGSGKKYKHCCLKK